MGFTHVVLSLGYMSEAITGHFEGHNSNLTLDFVVEEQPLGTGGAVRLALARCNNDHIFVFNGDTFIDLEVDKVQKLWDLHQNPIVVGRNVEDTERYGRLNVTDGIIHGFSEKGVAGPGLINAGCYVIARNQLDNWSLNEAFSMETDHLVGLVEADVVRVFETKGTFIDIGIPEDYQKAQELLANLD